MPVQTRSQKIAFLQQNVKPHVKQEQVSILQWFLIYTKKSINAFKRLMSETENIKSQINQSKKTIEDLYGYDEKRLPSHTKFLLQQSKDQNRENYFNRIRLFIEIYYNCEQYIDQVFQQAIADNKKERYLNFIAVFYKKSAETQHEICTSKYEPRTQEERTLIKTALLQFFATDAVLKKYLTKEQQYYKVKRLRQLK